MSSRYADNQLVQLVAVDHKSLFTVVVYAYERVEQGRSERALLHRGVLSLDFRPDPDEVNRLRKLQRGLRELDTDEARAQADGLELRVQREHGADRSASSLAALTLDEVLDAGVRWSVVGKRGAPISITPQLVGLLDRLFSSGEEGTSGSTALEGTEDPEATSGRVIFSSGGALQAYRPPGSVADVYRALSFVDRPTLDSSIDAVVGDGPDSEEMATWLERDFEAVTARYEVAASRDLGLHYRYS
jgi:hypothetical protein